MKTSFRILIVLLGLAALSGCAQKQELSSDQLEKLLQENPQIVLSILEENKLELVSIVEKGIQERMQAEQRKGLENALKNPYEPAISLDRPYLGPAEAPITIVEYSDFFCPYCAQGAETAKNMVANNPRSVRLFFKHLPLKPLSKTAAYYFEAIGRQDSHLAWVFADRIFDNQRKVLDQGEPALREIAADLGLNMEQIEQDIQSDEIRSLVEADAKEAGSFGINGTPTFLVNGVPLRGAVPAQEFERIIDLMGEQEPSQTQ